MAVVHLLCIFFSTLSFYSKPNQSYVFVDERLFDHSVFTSALVSFPDNMVRIGIENLQQIQQYYSKWLGLRRKCITSGCLKGTRISYNSNSTATYRRRLLLLYDIEVNPGPDQSTNLRKLKCLSLNSRSLVNKARYLKAMESSNEHDLLAVTETWLNPCGRDSELRIEDTQLINTAFNIHRRDWDAGVCRGGVLLAVGNHLKSDLETDAELLACEIKPENRKKFLCLIFYTVPYTDIIALKSLKQRLKKANDAHFKHFHNFYG